MKKISPFIIGLLALPAMMFTAIDTHAEDICNPNNINNHYKSLYCGIRLYDNETADNEIIGTLSSQFDMDEEIIKEILADTICQTYQTYDEDKKAEQPEAVRDACLPSGKSVQQTLGGWSVFEDIKNSYEKEKVIWRSASSLKFKFMESEQYWDGQISVTSGAPFDLIVDLNLVEIVLFGSEAEWMQDVYSFPEEEEAEEGETPVDGAVPPEEGPAEPTPPPAEPGESGVTITEEEGGGTVPPDCVPPDDSEADTGDGPGSNYENPVCGNGTVDILMAEECDDGNRQSGDGCSQYCKTEANGSNDQCVDPEAVTFKKPAQQTGGGQNTGAGSTGGTGGTSGTGGTGGTGETSPECPPGTVPKKSTTITGTEPEVLPTVEQSPEYPGPSLGGTLKQYPESYFPACGPGETQVGTEDDGTPICMQTELCADANTARDFLFGEGWEDDEAVMNIAPAIEAVFCLNITEANRPGSPYQTNEGCVDCHVRAMADSLEKALETNVSPLVNTTSAFGISSKYGPSFSFDLMTADKGSLKYKTTNTASTVLNNADKNDKQSERASTPPALTVRPSQNLTTELYKKNDEITARMKKIQEDTRMFRVSGLGLSEREVGGRISPLITQMRNSFVNIQSKFEEMISVTALDEKKQCEP